MTPTEARAELHAWVTNPALRHHMECVAACMAAYARDVAPNDVDRWFVCGLLHDLDWEKHPTKEEHPRVGVAHLKSKGVDDEILDAIMGHAAYTGTPRTSAMSKHLFACDELSGFIVACGKVRPDGVATLEPSSVKKKLKNLAFAAAVNRDEIAEGAKDLGVDFDAHCERCIAAIRTVA
ncbi:MAG: HDIG domain-containing protein [Phycisphaerales bacterium]